MVILYLVTSSAQNLLKPMLSESYLTTDSENIYHRLARTLQSCDSCHYSAAFGLWRHWASRRIAPFGLFIAMPISDGSMLRPNYNSNFRSRSRQKLLAVSGSRSRRLVIHSRRLICPRAFLAATPRRWKKVVHVSITHYTRDTSLGLVYTTRFHPLEWAWNQNWYQKLPTDWFAPYAIAQVW